MLVMMSATWEWDILWNTVLLNLAYGCCSECIGGRAAAGALGNGFFVTRAARGNIRMKYVRTPAAVAAASAGIGDPISERVECESVLRNFTNYKCIFWEATTRSESTQQPEDRLWG